MSSRTSANSSPIPQPEATSGRAVKGKDLDRVRRSVGSIDPGFKRNRMLALLGCSWMPNKAPVSAAKLPAILRTPLTVGDFGISETASRFKVFCTHS